MSEKKYDLEDRLVELAANIVFLCKELPSDAQPQTPLDEVEQLIKVIATIIRNKKVSKLKHMLNLILTLDS